MFKQLKIIALTSALSCLSFFSINANATIIELTNRCSSGDSLHGISVSDVTGNAGSATDCWGTFNGNDRGPGVTLTDGTTSWDFLTKYEVDEDIIEGTDIGLTLAENYGDTGTWSFNPDIELDSFIIVLKAANAPGWAAYQFTGSDASSYYGDWSVAWGRDLSHFSIYAENFYQEIPEPGLLMLFGLGLAASGFSLRKRK